MCFKGCLMIRLDCDGQAMFAERSRHSEASKDTICRCCTGPECRKNQAILGFLQVAHYESDFSVCSACFQFSIGQTVVSYGQRYVETCPGGVEPVVRVGGV